MTKPPKAARSGSVEATTMKHVIIALLTACHAKPSHPPTVKELCKLENDQREVTFTAYLTVPTMVGECRTACNVLAADVPEYTNSYINLTFPIGSGPLTMNPLPPVTQNLQQIGAGSFVVNDSDGKPRRIGEQVIVKGKLSAKTMKLDMGRGSTAEVVQCELTPTSIRSTSNNR